MEKLLNPLYEQLVAFLKQEGVWDTAVRIYSSIWEFVNSVAQGSEFGGIGANTPVLGWVIKFLKLVVDIIKAFIQVFMDIATMISGWLS